MTRAEYPPVAELVPHRGRMILLSRVLDHARDETVCSAWIEGDSPFASAAGRLGAWWAIEYMAQAVAVHAGLSLRRRGEAPRMGLLLGCRRVRLHAPFLSTGQKLEARVRRLWGGDQGLVAFDCTLKDAVRDALVAEGRLNCFLAAPGSGLAVRA